jgi:hypothetical protein
LAELDTNTSSDMEISKRLSLTLVAAHQLPNPRRSSEDALALWRQDSGVAAPELEGVATSKVRSFEHPHF